MDDSKLINKQNQGWQAGLNIPTNRFPRPGVDYVEELLRHAWPPRLVMRENFETDSIELVIQFPGTLQKLPDGVRDVYFCSGKTIDKAFQEVLRTVLLQKTLRAELSGVGYNAYRETWLHLVRTHYLDAFHDRANEWLRKQIETLKKNTRRVRRDKESPIDRANLLTRYDEMLQIAKRVHSATSDVVDQFKAVVPNIPANEKMTRILTGIWERVKDLYGKRVAHLIFSGEALRHISVEDEQYANARYLLRLERPEDWTPEELAAALLAIEEGKKYKVVRSRPKETH
jgi:hypothetical protein